jgi:hypothetical protein
MKKRNTPDAKGAKVAMAFCSARSAFHSQAAVILLRLRRVTNGFALFAIFASKRSFFFFKARCP